MAKHNIEEYQFKKGQSGNPKGRPKGKPRLVLDKLKKMLSIQVDKGSNDFFKKLQKSFPELFDGENPVTIEDLLAVKMLQNALGGNGKNSLEQLADIINRFEGKPYTQKVPESGEAPSVDYGERQRVLEELTKEAKNRNNGNE